MTARSFGELLAARRTGQPVRRHSYDVGDKRADVFRPIGDGSRADALAWTDAWLRVAEEWDDLSKQRGERHPIGAAGLRVLRVLLKNCTDFATGRCEPCLETIQRHTRYARPTVVRLLKKLKGCGFLDWVRRTVRTGNAPGEGPLVRQTSNAYFFDARQLPGRALRRLQELRGRWKAKREGAGKPRRPSMAERVPEPQPGSQAWAIAHRLAAIDGALAGQSASSASVLNPASGEVQKE